MSKHLPFIKLPFYISLITLAILGVLSYYPINTNFWLQFVSTINYTDVFCELTRPYRLIREPINTLSNLPYLFVGLLVLMVTARDRFRKFRLQKLYNNLLISYPIYGYVMGTVLILIFLFSSFFHASLTAVAQQLDMAGVNAMLLFPMIYSVHRIYNYYYFKKTYFTKRGLPFLFLGFFVVATVILTLFKWQLNAMFVVPGLVILSILLFSLSEWLCPNHSNKRWLMVAGGAILIGMVFYLLDEKKIGCNHNSIFQAHALWHLFAATSSLALYLYLRSENLSHKFKQYRLHL